MVSSLCETARLKLTCAGAMGQPIEVTQGVESRWEQGRFQLFNFKRVSNAQEKLANLYKASKFEEYTVEDVKRHLEAAAAAVNASQNRSNALQTKIAADKAKQTIKAESAVPTSSSAANAQPTTKRAQAPKPPLTSTQKWMLGVRRT